MDMTDRQIAAAAAYGEELLRAGPVATAARCDAAGRVAIELANGCGYTFPASLVQDLQGATLVHLQRIEVDGQGLNLHWPLLDVDLHVPALVAGLFGTRAWMARELAGIAGRARSPAKAAAARLNGVKGGRPRKSASA